MKWGQEVERLVTDQISESRTLEYKREFALGTAKQRIEISRDLSAMANAGGGVVIFGIAESAGSDGSGVAAEVIPLTERELVGRLVDTLRDSVRPPLVLELHPVDVGGGYVLVIEVSAASLGPHMLERNGEYRYYTRSGTSVVEMGEQQVRDAYALSMRRADRRDAVWAAHDMPPAFAPGPWLSVSVVPHEPLIQRFQAGAVTRSMFTFPPSLRHVLSFAQLSAALANLSIWAHGLEGSGGSDDGAASVAVRIHEDGALACGQKVQGPFTIADCARAVNAMVAWSAWMLHDLGVSNNVEVAVRLDLLNQTTLTVVDGYGAVVSCLAPKQPAGVPPIRHLEVRHEFRPRSLEAARDRHDLVRQFSDRTAAAFGIGHQPMAFVIGPLFNHEGRSTGLAVVGDRLRGDKQPDVVLHADGGLMVSHNGRLVGHLVQGAVLDEFGDTLAVTELAVGDGCPASFVPQEPGLADQFGAVGNPFEIESPRRAPTPTGRWSPSTLVEVLSITRGMAP